MITFYVSIRPINIEGRLITPKHMLSEGFKGIPIEWKCIAGGHPEDGRWLYEIKTEKEYQEIILEGLQMWGVHLKSLASAKSLADRLTNTVWTIDEANGVLIPPQREEIL